MEHDLQSMSLEELRNQKMLWYRGARDDGDIEKCRLVCMEFGIKSPSRTGSQYCPRTGGIDIHLDEYGHDLEVRIGDKLVVQTHQGKELFVPGPWMSEIKILAKEAQEKIEIRIKAEEEKERQKLIDELSL